MRLSADRLAGILREVRRSLCGLVDLLSVGLKIEDKGSGIAVGKGLGIELNKETTWLDSTELGVALGDALGIAVCPAPWAAVEAALGDAGGAASWAAPGATLGIAPGATLGTTPGAALGTAPGNAADGAIGMVLERIEVEEGESLMPID